MFLFCVIANEVKQSCDYDQVGSLRAVYDATGAIVKRIDYDSFGNIIADTNPTFTVPFGFAGGLDDRDIGLVHFGFRDYDPATGRWTAKDPIGFAGGDVDVYGYVLNDPVNLIDPFGLEENSTAEDISSWGSAAAGGIEAASNVVNYGPYWGEIGTKPISTSGLLPNQFDKWGGTASKLGAGFTFAATGFEIYEICKVQGDSHGKKAKKVIFAAGANTAGYFAGIGAVGYLFGAGTTIVIAGATAPAWVTAVAGVAVVGGIGYLVSISKKAYNNYVDKN
ncbi:MAG: RHS repeat-associated core domain-containing protein [Candidatus Omnitrophica bacterium]|nr:RHS repeat-associated core domain-containing protein [Candidatus Omnitrophota bacterium]